MTVSPIAQQKSELRQRVRSLRQGISPARRLQLDDAVSTELLQFVGKLKATSVSAFWTFDGEPDLRAALATLHENGITIALPVLNPLKPSTISMVRWTAESVMKRNGFGIMEPADEPVLAINKLDCMLIPLVAWDKSGGRLGMGGGYYDRLLTPVRTNRQPLRIGLAYGLQEVPRVPIEQNDVGLHGVICEHGWISAES
jgi:5-formyltetrahydrofolate cyclo-ligase